MTAVALRVSGLGKQYRLGRAQPRYQTLRDALTGAWGKLTGMLTGGAAASNTETIWALQDISFTVHPGEMVGIIGQNGAGKSTLLKVLSRITAPTLGSVDVFGRASALLEVGTGFHQELTGRENIYLNGAILGMRRREIERKFDEIVAFAEVERFVDTAIKHYSSGMYLRLAFSVAAHLEPDLLFIDEVLAVGDLAFQEKCLGKMNDVASAGRTVLFVSHNMATIQQLCSRCILLERGALVEDATPAASIAAYMTRSRGWGHGLPESSPGRPLSLGHPILVGGSADALELDQEFSVEIPFRTRPVEEATLVVTLEDFMGRTFVHQRLRLPRLGQHARDDGRIRINFPPLHLAPGTYVIYAKVHLLAPAAGGPGIVTTSRLPVTMKSDHADIGNRIVGRQGALLAPPLECTINPHHELTASKAESLQPLV